MSKVRFVCAATFVLAVCSHVHAYTLYVSSTETPYRVQKWDLQTNTVVDDFTTGANLYAPGGMAIGPDGNLYVGDRGSSSVLRFNATTGQYIDVFATAPPRGALQPGSLQFGPDGDLYVSSFNLGSVTRFNGSTGAYMNVVASGVRGLSGMDFGPDGKLYASSYFDSAVYRFDPATGANLGQFVSTPIYGELRFGSDGHLYVACASQAPEGSGVYRFDGQTGAAMGRFAGMRNPYGLQFAPNGDLYVAGVNSVAGIKRVGPSGEELGYVGTGGDVATAGGYILITPEPASIVLLAVGGGLLLRRRGQAA